MRISLNPIAWVIIGLAAVIIGVAASWVSNVFAMRFITGAVLRQDADPGKQLPIANAKVSLADNLSDGEATSDSAGRFHLRLRKDIHSGQIATLRLRHPAYRPLDISESLMDRLYIVRMVPINLNLDSSLNPSTVLSDIRVRYAMKSELAVNAGSALKSFEVVNVGDVPCGRKGPCSPDGKWTAAIGGVTLDAGENSAFHEVRVSCIAGPCPFTKIEKDSFSRGGRYIGVTVRNWSDTATFLVEAEVTRTTNGDAILESFPVVFDRAMSFTLPVSAQGPSIEAAVDGEDVVFPLGPTLALSWAVCNVETSAGGTKLYRCVLKPGYRFR